MDPLQPFSFDPIRSDYHAVVSITIRELIDGGIIDFDSCDFDFDSYNQEQRDRFWKKFKGRYYLREIGIIPYKAWHFRLIARLNEIMPKYAWIYKALDEGLNPWQIGSEYNKSRSIDSDFPQTMLSGNSDYASFGRDFEHEKILMGDFLEKLKTIKDIDSVDTMILDELEVLFSCLMTVHINAR